MTRSEFTWEIIVVDDGSKDKTKEVAYEYAKQYPKSAIRVLVEYSNRGKGGAIRMGVLSCSDGGRGRCNNLFGSGEVGEGHEGGIRFGGGVTQPATGRGRGEACVVPKSADGGFQLLGADALRHSRNQRHTMRI